MGPQLENGYTQIANLVLEDLAKACLSGPQYQLVFVVLRKTWGDCERDIDGSALRDGDGRPIKKQWAHIGTQEFADITGMAKSTVIRGLQALVDMGILVTRPSEGRRPAAYRYQKYADRWQTVGHKCNLFAVADERPQTNVVVADERPQAGQVPTDQKESADSVAHQIPQDPLLVAGQRPQTPLLVAHQIPQNGQDVSGSSPDTTNGDFMDSHQIPQTDPLIIRNKDLNKLSKETAHDDDKEGPPSLEELHERYSPQQQEAIKRYWTMIRRTRKGNRLAMSVVQAWMDKWSTFPPELVIQAMKLHIEKYPNRREEYTHGIIRGLKRDMEGARGNNGTGATRPGKLPASIDRSKFVYAGDADA
ncbi:MAG: hypothetical protein C4570_06560 [Ammonifex sp.]|jgi:hypothetical protein|nr:MAG: hypothetical protein C4570_06560 [Ammonifex sp.]